MEVPQGNSLCSYLKQEKNVIFFSFTKSENRTGRQNRYCLGGKEGFKPMKGRRRWGKV
jgi:hypothetical protein